MKQSWKLKQLIINIVQKSSGRVTVDTKIYGTTRYDLLTIQGEITLKNYKNIDIDLNVKRTITGELKESDSNWLKNQRINIQTALNKITDVCWELNLKKSEEKKIIYTYKVIVPIY